MTDCVEKGKRFYTKGDIGPAIDMFKNALREDNTNVYAMFELGKAYYDIGRYAEAIEVLYECIRSHSPDRQLKKNALILIAKSQKDSANYKEAMELADGLFSGAQNDPILEGLIRDINAERYGNIRDVSEYGNDYDKLISFYLNKLNRNPHDVKSVCHLAQIYNYLGRYGDTVDFIEKNGKFIGQDDAFFHNKLLNEFEIARKKTRLDSRVRSLVVTLSNACNISCRMCLTSKHPWEVPESKINEIISLFPYLEKVMWQGGEVFYLKYFKDILKEASRYPNMRQSVVTNGQIMDKEYADLIARNNIEVTFSVDGTDKNTYEYIRRGAKFEKLLQNIRLISSLKKQVGSRIIMNMNVAVMKSNYKQLRSFAEFAEKCGFEFLCLMPINIHEKCEEDIFRNNDLSALDFITKESISISEKYNNSKLRIENRLPLIRPDGTAKFRDKKKADSAPSKKAGMLCHIPWHQLLIDYDGTVRPDCLCNVNKNAGSFASRSIEDVWNSYEIMEYRRKIIENKTDDICNKSCVERRIKEAHLKHV